MQHKPSAADSGILFPDMQVVVDDLIVSYARSGSGKSVVLLHGWGDSSNTFSELQSVLAQQYDVTAVDLPGFGGTKAPAVPWGLDDYAAFVAHFVAKIGTGPVYAYLGHSNGGAIAIRGLVNGGLQSERLVLLASAGVRSEDQTKKKAVRLLAKTAKLAAKPLPSRLQQKLKKRAYSAIGSDLFVTEGMQETFKRIITDDVQADAAKLTLPTLLMYGDVDQATPPAWGQKLHGQVTGSQFTLVPGAGHFVHHDQPAQVAAAITEFLK